MNYFGWQKKKTVLIGKSIKIHRTMTQGVYFSDFAGKWKKCVKCKRVIATNVHCDSREMLQALSVASLSFDSFFDTIIYLRAFMSVVVNWWNVVAQITNKSMYELISLVALHRVAWSERFKAIFFLQSSHTTEWRHSSWFVCMSFNVR